MNSVARVVIDKLPLNIIHLPLIATLFPNPKIIFSLRHPADVCLSCFQQNFLLNAAMAFFTELGSAFERYRDVMMLFERYRNELKLDLHTVRYEELVQDLDGVARGVFDYLGIEGDEAYRDFHRRNQEKLIATPSKEQVSQPIYQSSRERWRNYERELEPHLPIVQDLINAYGY